MVRTIRERQTCRRMRNGVSFVPIYGQGGPRVSRWWRAGRGCSAATHASHGSGLDIKSMSQASREASAFVTIFSLEAVVCVEVEQHE